MKLNGIDGIRLCPAFLVGCGYDFGDCIAVWSKLRGNKSAGRQPNCQCWYREELYVEALSWLQFQILLNNERLAVPLLLEPQRIGVVAWCCGSAKKLALAAVSTFSSDIITTTINTLTPE